MGGMVRLGAERAQSTYSVSNVVWAQPNHPRRKTMDGLSFLQPATEQIASTGILLLSDNIGMDSGLPEFRSDEESGRFCPQPTFY